jgi:hypothetical protein
VSISSGVVKGRILSESFQVEVGAKLEKDTNHSPVTPVASLEKFEIKKHFTVKLLNFWVGGNQPI